MSPRLAPNRRSHSASFVRCLLQVVLEMTPPMIRQEKARLTLVHLHKSSEALVYLLIDGRGFDVILIVRISPRKWAAFDHLDQILYCCGVGFEGVFFS